jgi:hypothetical protein
MLKKSFLPIVFLGAIGIIVAIAFMTVTKSETNTFALYRENGDVYYKEDITDEYILLEQDEMTLEHKSFVKTTSGYAHILFEDGSMLSLDNNSEVQVFFAQDRIEINQQAGNVWHRVIGGKAYSVVTLASSVETLGTIFAVHYEDGNKQQATIYVIEDSVRVKQIIETSGKKSESAELVIQNGQSISFSPKTAFSQELVSSISESVSTSIWYKRNVIIDSEFSKQPAKKFITNIKNFLDIKALNDPGPQTAEQVTNIISKIEDSDNVKNTEVYDFLISFQERYDITVVEDEVCTNIKSDQFATDKEKLETYKDEIGEANYTQLLNYLDKLEKSCEDEELSPDELEELKSIFIDQYEENEAEQREKFLSAVEAKLALYLEIDDDGREVCARLAETDTDEIISELEEIETEYEQTHAIDNVIRPVLTKIATSCEDNTISVDELKDIESLTPSEYYQ